MLLVVWHRSVICVLCKRGLASLRCNDIQLRLPKKTSSLAAASLSLIIQTSFYLFQPYCKVAKQVIYKLHARLLRRVYGNIARQVFCKINARSHRWVYGNIAREPFCKQYARFFGKHIAMVPCKCFTSLMGCYFCEYIATFSGNLFASFMEGSLESVWQHYQESVLQA